MTEQALPRPAARAGLAPRRVVLAALQLGVAGILLQTLWFKFTGAPESRWIFTQLGIEPWGRIATGVAELVAAVLLLVPATAAVGAALSLAIISGAVVGHLTRLGIVVMDDGGLLFALACLVFAGSVAILWLRRDDLSVLARQLRAPRRPR